VEIQNHISQLLSISKRSLFSNYLGVPLMGETTHNISWDSLLLSISNSISNLTFTSLNLPSHLVLLKSVLQDLPNYLFISLATPQYVIRAIRNIQHSFLWHGHHPNKKWAMVGWDKICRPKYLGGLGLKDLRKINRIMGEKLWWHWLKNPKQL